MFWYARHRGSYLIVNGMRGIGVENEVEREVENDWKPPPEKIWKAKQVLDQATESLSYIYYESDLVFLIVSKMKRNSVLVIQSTFGGWDLLQVEVW